MLSLLYLHRSRKPPAMPIGKQADLPPCFAHSSLRMILPKGKIKSKTEGRGKQRLYASFPILPLGRTL